MRPFARFFRRRPKPAIVLGVQLAEAQAREEAHRGVHDQPSPLPPLQYSAADVDLLEPQPVELDRELASLCSRFAGESSAGRTDLMNAATMDDFYTLLAFARRASVFALRDGDEGWIRLAMTAIAMIDPERLDERDVLLTLSLPNHAAEQLGLSAVQIFDAAAAIAQSRVGETIRRFVRQSADYKDIQKSWGFVQITTPAGVGIAESGFRPYHPTRDIVASALQFRRALAADHYDAGVTLASELPAIWFPSANRERAQRILARSLATVSLQGHLHPDVLAFIVETRSASEAQTLIQLATGEGSPESAIAAAAGPIFALVTPVRLERFENDLQRAIQAAVS